MIFIKYKFIRSFLWKYAILVTNAILKNMIQQTINLPLDKAIEVVYNDVISYVGSHQHLTDDITVIMIEIL